MVHATPTVTRRSCPGALGPLLVLALLVSAGVLLPATQATPPPSAGAVPSASSAPTNSSSVGNFTASINRLVELVGLAGSGLLALVWARVALSWFSNDVTKKVQAKDRARDALVGTFLFVAAISGLIWGLAHWVLTGS
ncbi:MAG: hypothetical protein ACLPZM_02650 [Thermoplasmata archaeon]